MHFYFPERKQNKCGKNASRAQGSSQLEASKSETEPRLGSRIVAA